MPPPTDFLSLLVLLCLFASLRPCRAESVSQSRAPKSKPTPIYLDVTPGYKSLSACAELPLSTLIRNMWNGCGDDSGLTSYSCFCTDSYSKFSWDISTAVVSHCGDGLAAQATSAVSVFHEYCASGTTQLFKTAAATKTATQNFVIPTRSTGIGPSVETGIPSKGARGRTVVPNMVSVTALGVGLLWTVL